MESRNRLLTCVALAIVALAGTAYKKSLDFVNWDPSDLTGGAHRPRTRADDILVNSCHGPCYNPPERFGMSEEDPAYALQWVEDSECGKVFCVCHGRVTVYATRANLLNFPSDELSGLEDEAVQECETACDDSGGNEDFTTTEVECVCAGGRAVVVKMLGCDWWEDDFDRPDNYLSIEETIIQEY